MAMSSLTRGLGRFTTMGMTMSTFAKTAGALPRAAVRSMCSTKHSTSGDGEEKGFNPETPQQRMVWLLSLGGVGAATVYFLYRVWRDYYTDEGQAASAEGVLSTPLFEGNPVVFLDVAADGEQLGRMVFQLRKDLENFRQLFTGECGRSYKGSDFHSILQANYVVGGNVPGPAGDRHEAAAGGYIPDESFALQHTGPGILSSASQMRGENGSLFFITLAKAPNLNGRYVAFGNMLDGMDTLRAVGRLGDTVGRPAAKVTITDCGELRMPPGLEDTVPPQRQERQ